MLAFAAHRRTGAAHVHHALQVASGVRPALEAGTDFSFARIAQRARYCRTNALVANQSELPPIRGPVWGGMQRRLCPHVGRVVCAWGSHRCAASAREGERRPFFASTDA